MSGTLIFKQAESDAEFEQIHRLNYDTFVKEVGQYPADGSGILVDRFHDKNTYFVALEGGRLLGMVAVNDEPPFSVESRLPDCTVLDALGGPLLEVRLLALRPEARRGMILPGILWELYQYARQHRYSHLVISAIASQFPLYTKLGFKALGPAVPCGASSFVPMALSLVDEPAWLVRNARLYQAREHRAKPSSERAGPVGALGARDSRPA